MQDAKKLFTQRETVSQRLDSLTGIRGILAILVVVCHGVERVGWLESERISTPFFLAFGHFGVVGFFILSGFILRTVYQDRKWTLREFALNRFARIYPLYIACLLFTLPIDWLSPSFPVEGRTEALGLSVILQQAWFDFSNGRFNGPGWTLSTEFFFYASFPFLFAVQEKSRKIFVACLMLFIVTTGYFWDATIFQWSHRIPHMRVWEFILGMVAADFYRRFTFRGFIQWNSALAGLSLVAGVGLGAWAHGSSWPFLEWLTMAACGVSMIMLLAYSDKCGRGWRPMATTHWILCGEISYAIYLLHDGIQRYGRVAVEHITAVPIHALPAWTKISLIGISIVASFLSAIALWKYWEIPSRDWLRRTFC